MTDESKPTVDYTVQMAKVVTEATEPAPGLSLVAADEVWVDVATVTVPVGTKRKTVLRQALAGMEVGEQAPRLRALDADSAEVHEPKSETTTTWVI
jgi:hypothetical protein